MHDNSQTVERERAVLAGLTCADMEDSSSEATLDELEDLLETAQGDCVARVLQKRESPDPRTFIGEGKVREIRDLCQAHQVDLVIFDNELSPSQTRCLEQDTGVRVIDRSLLILDIFADRARTREGRVQVEMAQLKYILPRLAGLGLSLSRQGGGIGTRRGPGETKLETDRRHIRRRIGKLSEELDAVRRVRELQRDRHEKNEIPVVSLIGYTNAGKSTLFNTLTDAGIPARDRLFDTLDTTTRSLELNENAQVLLTDTVGFIRKLPHHLVEAFRATLDELRYADLLLHVVDLSNPEWEQQAAVVDELADRLGTSGIPRLRVFNKSDLLPPDLALFGRDGVVISAATGEGIDRLRTRMTELLGLGVRRVELLLPYNQASKLDMLHREAKVLSQEYAEDGIAVEVTCNQRVFGQVRDYERRPAHTT